MFRRRHGDRQVMFDEVAESDHGMVHRECEDWSNCPEKYCTQRELNGILDDALTGLSPRLGAAFYLHSVEDLSIRETATKLGLSVNGVKSRVSRARSRLRKRLHAVLRDSGHCPWKQGRRRGAAAQGRKTRISSFSGCVRGLSTASVRCRTGRWIRGGSRPVGIDVTVRGQVPLRLKNSTCANRFLASSLDL